jgi:hypothetical protein
MSNKNDKVIEEFGEEWTKFNYSSIDTKKLRENFDQYFSIFLGIYCQKMLLVLIWVVVLVDGHNSSLQKLKL